MVWMIQCHIWVCLFLCLGVILSILNIWGNSLVKIIWAVRCVISGAIILIVVFNMFIDMLSWPTECLSFDFLMIWVISDIVEIGMLLGRCFWVFLLVIQLLMGFCYVNFWCCWCRSYWQYCRFFGDY